ncbi:MAG: autotransporter outer membrane beta-barrel domain-containing protein [Fusobacterium varium]|uniref:autotransporter family protein n=1 Tax=Fusobacterium varium TaxID=856 RepID=UPI00243126E2|nr:autotransporter outer membrane beta-barrel domain-containing protein [Fusobacterium varium]UYI77642.1 MAG: autotransporter outer membrane beta-barrel domain-containing protein [Fusobacterium varium]
MISNFNEVEKSLKRCLKEKISITTAAVVGFLIAGTVAFGGDYTNDNFSEAIEGVSDNKSGLSVSKDTTLVGVKYTYEGTGAIQRLITVEGGKTTLDENTSISTAENVTLLNIYRAEAENKGTLTNINTNSSIVDNWRPTVIVNANTGNASFTNSGTITKTGHPEYNCAVDLSSGQGYTSTFTNTGTINGLIKSDSNKDKNTEPEKQLGDIIINLKDSSKINGEFSFAGGGTRTINIDNNNNGGKELIVNNTEDNETFIKTNNSDITLRGKIQSKGTTVELNNKDGVSWDGKIEAGSNILRNEAHIFGKIGIGVVNDIKSVGSGTGYTVREIRIINNGKITASFQGIFNGDVIKYNKTHIENAKNGEIVVNDFERTTNGDKPYWYNTGIYSASFPLTETPGEVINNGKVTIDLTGHQEELKEKYRKTNGDMYINIHGLRLNEHTYGYNNGTILVNSFGGVGVVLYNGDSNANNLKGVYEYFENNGTIEVNGDKGIGLQLSTSGEINAVKEAINTKDGSITVSGENAIGVKVDGVTTTFTNDGTITLKEGTVKGTGISVVRGTAINNGTIALGLGTIENSNNNIAIKNEGGTAKNTGKIKITDKASEELKDFDISTLFNGSYINSGMLVDKNGIAIEKENDVEISGNTNAGDINNAEKEGSSIVVKGETTIKGSTGKPIEVESLNVTGKVTIANGGEGEEGVEIKGTTTNLDANGSLAIGSSEAASLTITNGTVNAEDNGTAVTFAHEDSSLELSGTTFNGNIGSDTTKGTVKTSEGEKATVITGNIEAKSVELAGTTVITGNIKTESMAVTAGETKIAGIITGATKINIGTNPETEFILLSRAASTSNNPENATVAYSADSKIIGKEAQSQLTKIDSFGTTVNIGANGILKAEVDNDGKNLFGNSTNINVSGDGTIQFLVSNVTKENLELKFGDTVNISGISNILTDSEFYSYDNTNKMLSFIKNNVNNKDLADIYNKSFVINNVLAQTRDAREAQLDSIYSNNVYSETVKMSMDTLRINEEAVLSLGGKPEEGKWTAQGKMLFSRTEYDRDGKVNSYGVETKTAGLLGAMEYGLSEKSSVGFAFSGTKQDLDMKKASADGDAFYFGVYGKQDINNFKLTAGLGYQLNKIDADNNVIDSTGDKYDSKAFSGYAQGKYVINAGNNVTVEPKVKLALTRLTQESAKDKHFEMEKENITTFDTEVGVDLVKSVKLESGKMNLLAGISYTRTVGDTDDKFKGNFIGTDGTRGDKFDVLGANLGENTLKINIGAEVEKDNGFFYNGGLNYKFDNEDRETFGATIGAGYKF